MVLCSVIVRFDLINISTLKGRRRVVNSIKDRLKRFNVSILDISGEYTKEAEIAMVFLSHSDQGVLNYLDKIEHFLYKNFGEYEFDIEYELI